MGNCDQNRKLAFVCNLAEICNFSTVGSMHSTGLRETKKAAARLALASAVLRLATRDGIDRVTIDTVAAEAGVSVRTFHNYFSGKEDALVFFAAALFDSIVDRIESQPLDESFWSAVRSALVDVATSPDLGKPAEFVTLLRLLDSEPIVAAHSQHVDLIGQIDARVEALFTQRGQDGNELYPHLVLHNAIATTRVALEFWVARAQGDDVNDPDKVRTVLDAALDQVQAGMAQPISRPMISRPKEL